MNRLEIEDRNSPEEFERFSSDMEIDDTIDTERQEALGDKFSGGKFADLGCGLFGLCAKIKKRFPKSEVWGLDYSEKIIECCKKNFPRINYITSDCYFEPLLFRDNYLDYVVSGSFIEHLEEPAKFIKEVHRVLKPGGIFSFSVPLDEGRNRRVSSLHLWSFNEEDAKELMKEFDDVEITILTTERFNKIIAYGKKHGHETHERSQ